MKRSGKPQLPGSFWTLPELCQKVHDALAVEYQPAQNGQVRPVPDIRTARYYGTLGLLDRPAMMQGRTAYYGRRHLLQLVAVKRLQAQGLALPEVQRRLYGLTDGALAEIAGLPVDVEAGEGPAPAPPALLPSRRDGAFWEELPQAAPPAAPPEGPAATTGGTEDDPLHGVQLDDGVLLLFRGDGPAPTAAERQALRQAAAPLLALLRRQRPPRT